MRRTILVLTGLLAVTQHCFAQGAGFPGNAPEGRFNLAAGSTAGGVILATVPSPAYYRVCVDGELGSDLRIRVSGGSGSPSFIMANSCTDLLVAKKLKVGFAPGSLITTVVGRYDLLGFRQATQVSPLDN